MKAIRVASAIGILLGVVVANTLWAQDRPGLEATQNPADTEAIRSLIDQYCRTDEAWDMTGQAKLMTPDRVFIDHGGRRTDQALYMRVQQAQGDDLKKWAPEVLWFIEPRDLMIRFYGNGTVAVASFYRVVTSVVPASAPEAVQKAFDQDHPPMVVTHVLIKSDGQWKIAHTQFTRMTLIGPPQ